MMDSARQNLPADRLWSVDALRGYAMFWIIGGNVIFKSFRGIIKNPITDELARQATHVKWLGFTHTDLVMPLFLFVVGIVMPFSLLRRLEKGESRIRVYRHVIKRTVLLIFFGLIVSGLLRFKPAGIQYAGVLQRIGICYFFAATFMMFTTRRTQIFIICAILFLGWVAMTFIPVPGYGAGIITREACLSGYIDREFLPGTIHKGFYGYGDSNGILPTLMSVSTVLIGVLTGYWLRSNHTKPAQKATGLALAGLISLTAGYLWGLFFPVVRLIWTSSMVLFAGGWSLLLLALFYWLIDVKGYKKWSFFFIVIGMNAIAAYLLKSFADFNSISNYFFLGAAEHAGVFKNLILACGVVIIEWMVLWFLYRRRIFFKL